MVIDFSPSTGSKRVAINPAHVTEVLEVSSIQTNVWLVGRTTPTSVKGSYEEVCKRLNAELNSEGFP